MSFSAIEWANRRKEEIAAEIKTLQTKMKEWDEQKKKLDEELKHLEYFFRSIVPGTSSSARVTAVDGAVIILNREGKFMNIGEITDGLLELGFESNAKNPRESVRATLSGEIQKDNPRLVRHMGYFGLPGWEHDFARMASVIGIASSSITDTFPNITLDTDAFDGKAADALSISKVLTGLSQAVTPSKTSSKVKPDAKATTGPSKRTPPPDKPKS